MTKSMLLPKVWWYRDSDRAYHFGDLVCLRIVKTGDRLIEQHHDRLFGHRPRQLGKLAMAIRQVGRLCVA